MQALKKVHLLHLVLLTLNFFPKSIAKQNPTSFCGKITIQKPFFLQNSTESSLLSHMVVCKSQKLYFRTSLGLFQISSIDYTTKLLTISHSSCSSSSNYVSPALLSAGFPSPPNPNSLALFDCSSKNHMFKAKFNCTGLHGGKAALNLCEQKIDKSYSCLFVNDTEKLDKGFHPNDLNCSRYSRVYRRNSSVDDNLEGYELGTRISFDIPNHVPNICDECNKPHGNCGIGLKCICHPKDCKDKVISKSVTVDPFERGSRFQNPRLDHMWVGKKQRQVSGLLFLGDGGYTATALLHALWQGLGQGIKVKQAKTSISYTSRISIGIYAF